MHHLTAHPTMVLHIALLQVTILKATITATTTAVPKAITT